MFIISSATVLNVIIFLLETSISFVNLGNSKIIEAITLIIHKIVLQMGTVIISGQGRTVGIFLVCRSN